MDLILHPATLVPLLSALFGLIWMVAVVRRIYRLARYFQLEGYDSKRFLRWMGRSAANTLSSGTLAAMLLLIIPRPDRLQSLRAFRRRPGARADWGDAGILAARRRSCC